MENENKKTTTSRKGAAKKVPTQVEKEAGSDAVEETGTTAQGIAEPQKEKETGGDKQSGGNNEEVVVSKEDLKALMARLEKVEGENQKLIKVADKGRMFALDEAERAKNKNIPTVKLSRLGKGGKLIIAWKTKENQSYVDGNRTVIRQEIELFFQDGKSETMPHISFYRQQNKDTIASIVGRSVDERTGATMFKLEMSDGEILEIDKTFVN